MAKRSTRSTEPETETLPTYIPNPADACTDAAYRINVVIGMLQEHLDVCKPTPEDETPQGTGGFEIHVMREALEATRDMLQRSARKGAE